VYVKRSADTDDGVPVVSSLDRVASLRVQLSGHPYDIGAGEFVRFRTDANDETVAGIVHAVSAEGSDGCEGFRHGLSVTDADTLRLFAMRRTLQGRRQSSLGLIYDALDGFALLPDVDDVPWDSWFKATLFVARTLGIDLDTLGTRFEDIAHGDVANRYYVTAEAMNRIEEFDQCGMAEVSTTHGIGFVEILVFHDTRVRGRYNRPTLADNRIDFHPSSNLAQVTANVADALDTSGTVRTNPITQDQLAATMFSLTASGSYLATAGCLSFVADEIDGAGSFTVFVAELPADTDVEPLVQSAIDTDDQAALCDGQRLIVFSPQPSFSDDDDDIVLDLSPFVDIAHTALNDPATR
jgi:hypothetical protein